MILEFHFITDDIDDEPSIPTPRLHTVQEVRLGPGEEKIIAEFLSISKDHSEDRSNESNQYAYEVSSFLRRIADQIDLTN